MKTSLFKRTLYVVAIAQMFGGAGLSAGITVGALIAKEMLGTDTLSGLPITLFTVGSALSAALIGRLSHMHGRRIGLSLGFLVGSIGALGVLFSSTTGSIALLFISLFVYGAGSSANLQARYAGTDLADDKNTGFAISFTLMFTTIGAVLGPNITNQTTDLAKNLGLYPLSGPFILAFLSYTTASIVIFFFLKPDPLLIAKAKSDENVMNLEQTNITINKKIILGTIIMVTTQLIMVALMTMTPVHMTHFNHSVQDVGLVISLHIAAMYLPSLFTGKLLDRFGVFAMLNVSTITLAISGVLAFTITHHSLMLYAATLILLGIGWNIGLIVGTYLLNQGTTVQNRAKIQGNTDVFIALFGATGGALSGVIYTTWNWQTLAIISSTLAIGVLLLFLILFKKKKSE
ncbi:MAG: MFS transporter [Bacilli bacterium]